MIHWSRREQLLYSRQLIQKGWENKDAQSKRQRGDMGHELRLPALLQSRFWFPRPGYLIALQFNHIIHCPSNIFSFGLRIIWIDFLQFANKWDLTSIFWQGKFWSPLGTSLTFSKCQTWAPSSCSWDSTRFVIPKGSFLERKWRNTDTMWKVDYNCFSIMYHN